MYVNRKLRKKGVVIPLHEANIQWDEFAFIKKTYQRGEKKVYNGADRLSYLPNLDHLMKLTLKFRNSEIIRFEYLKGIAFKFRTKADL